MCVDCCTLCTLIRSSLQELVLRKMAYTLAQHYHDYMSQRLHRIDVARPTFGQGFCDEVPRAAHQNYLILIFTAPGQCMQCVHFGHPLRLDKHFT